MNMQPHELENLTCNQMDMQNANEDLAEQCLKECDSDGCKKGNRGKVFFKAANLSRIKWHDVIEKASLVLIPFSFVAFNIWYWIISLSSLEA